MIGSLEQRFLAFNLDIYIKWDQPREYNIKKNSATHDIPC